ncbi:hypothetical protein ACFOZ5_09905 [Marinobacter lacisalsi]|uniref:2-isopropylmalate synthase n=1 Tax=Marinobacter lacisalsi TaxID=475979 RepID=A0ABV8QHX4_9GAMM
MNEAQRQFVMGVAGVRLWYARSVLPGAAPSPDYDFGEPAGQTQSGTGSAEAPPVTRGPRPVSEASRKGLARLQGLLSETDAAPDPTAREEVFAGGGRSTTARTPAATRASSQSTPTETDVAPTPERVPVEPVDDTLAGKAIAFQWRFWIGEQWLLVSSCPDTASRGLEDRLAVNILKALGDNIVSTEVLRWPVFSNPGVPGNDARGAAEVVSAMAEATSRPKQLWLGLEPEESASGRSSLWQDVIAPLGEATVSFPGGLVALSSDPGAKHALWQALQKAGRS